MLPHQFKQRSNNDLCIRVCTAFQAGKTRGSAEPTYPIMDRAEAKHSFINGLVLINVIVNKNFLLFLILVCTKAEFCDIMFGGEVYPRIFEAETVGIFGFLT